MTLKFIWHVSESGLQDCHVKSQIKPSIVVSQWLQIKAINVGQRGMVSTTLSAIYSYKLYFFHLVKHVLLGGKGGNSIWNASHGTQVVM